ncbi:MAG: hypothetical protein K2X50_07315 [Gammaproteobacteria bacterium]|nr:hypothetical protein [Gammaproteobacteria bacterium]
MKRRIPLLSLILLTALNLSSAMASTAAIDTDRTPLNKVKIINNTAKDIGYIIISASTNTDLLYGVKAKKSDTYHAKATGDVNATVKVALCGKINKVTGVCSQFVANSVKNCVGEARYDFYKVKSVKIDSLDSCIITCNDGDKASCVVN